ncbi:unnamed protein product [Peronospora belbahrii]|uniref:Guanylate-binding protein N-terminal domain-containing protein n=1 Tax=Peronospora belbahrii TaxID=622444 RepID=A0AAU9KY84_9STRA|nr:unnamed protein product [Peronospora belbahrii]
MKATWRAQKLVDACGSLTTDGAHLLEQELHDDRLAVVLLIGSPSTCAERRKFVAKLLGKDDGNVAASTGDGLLLLATVTCVDEDLKVLILDVNTSDTGFSLEQLLGAFCALSSLVLSCYNEIESTEYIAAPLLPQFQSLFQTLMRDYSSLEVFEMLPKIMDINLSSNCLLGDKVTHAEKEERLSSVEALESLIRFKQVGLFSVYTTAQMNYDELCGLHATIKRLFGIEMTGEMLVAFLRKLSAQVFQQEPLDLGTAWDDFVEDKCRLLAEDAVSTYADCVHSSVVEHPPMELNAFTQLHEEIWRLSMDFYYSASKYKSTRYRTVRRKLKSDLRAHYDTELNILTQTSREFCEELRRTLWAEVYARATQSQDGSTFTAVLAAIQDFDKQYSEKARGPEKASVLRDFYQRDAIDAFQRLENIVTQQVSESRLEELRLQLEKDFVDKKMALVEHFKQEETQLRTGMARDMETMQKMHEAKAARAKVDGSEAKWLREKINEMKRQNGELQEKLVVLEHTQQDTASKKAVLEIKVDELESAVRREMANRTEILELVKKTSRIEGELQDSAHQLRKTTEEKEELQKKLNDFFLKVTALPEALQQHFFCIESGQVDFADAFTSFMSQ